MTNIGLSDRIGGNCDDGILAVEVNLPDTAIAAIRNETCTSEVSSLAVYFTMIHTTGDLDWIRKRFATTGAGAFRKRFRISWCDGGDCESKHVTLAPAFKDLVQYELPVR